MEQTQTPPTLSQRYTTFYHAVLFVLGFSLIFVVGWGGAATILGQLFSEYKLLIARIGGLVVILFGLATLGAILTLGFVQETSGQAMLLASGYALGLAVPFLLIGFGMNRAVTAVRRLRPHMRKIQIFSGVFLILIGIMLLTNQLALIAIWAQKNGLFLDLPLGASTAPTYIIAVLAGLLSFLSPCVLPLVPAYVGFLSGQAFAGVE
ncbi:MAG: hypothetical protein HF973_04415 [Chloroflexi bacterium]|nr:hypothetical protein [Chloroflexota bacterium]